MFTIDEFSKAYNAFISGNGIYCKGSGFCKNQEKCSFCPLYYMNNISMILFMLNNTPDYPRSNRLYLETQNEVKKVAYYNEKIHSWEIDYTWENEP